jgi:hypothetical protein
MRVEVNTCVGEHVDDALDRTGRSPAGQLVGQVLSVIIRQIHVVRIPTIAEMSLSTSRL